MQSTSDWHLQCRVVAKNVDRAVLVLVVDGDFRQTFSVESHLG